MDYTEFIRGFQSSLDELPEIQGKRSEINCSPEPISSFVAPPLESVEDVPLANVVLIEAAGAVGKSTLAKALARDLRWPLVHAEKAQVGSYSLSGLIHSAFGFQSDFLQRFSNGDVGVVVDALDEAHLRAGTPNFLSFINNIVELAKSATAGSRNLLLLSRSDTAELVRLAFMEEETPIEVRRISFFSRTSAHAFIDRYLNLRYEESGNPEYNVGRAFPIPFEKLRDKRMRQLGGALLGQVEMNLSTDWDKVREFLGYAPVLTAIAESLAVRNPSGHYSDDAKGAQTTWSLIGNIVERILLREQGKFISSMHDALHSLLPHQEESLPSNLYSPHEQAIRILDSLYGRKASVLPPATLSAEVRERYEESASQFTADHPFLRNQTFASAVFADFVHAQCSVGLEAHVALGSPHTPKIDEVGPFYLGFLVEALGESLTISERLIAPALKSWADHADIAAGNFEHASVLLWEEGGVVHLPGQTDSWHRGAESVTLQVDEVSGAVTLEYVPPRTIVHTVGGLILGSSRRPLVLRTPFVLSAREVEIQSEALSVIRGNDGSAGMLIAEVVVANSLASIDSRPQNVFEVIGSQVPPKLLPYRKPIREVETTFFLRQSDYVSLRAVLTSFRRTVHLGLSASRALMSKIVGRDSLRLAIMEELEELGIVRDHGEWLTLESSELGMIGFSLADLKKGEPTSEILGFVARCRQRMS